MMVVKVTYIATSLILNLVVCTFDSGFTRICLHVLQRFERFVRKRMGTGRISLNRGYFVPLETPSAKLRDGNRTYDKNRTGYLCAARWERLVTCFWDYHISTAVQVHEPRIPTSVPLNIFHFLDDAFLTTKQF